VTVLRERADLFAIGALVSGFVATLALNVVNPDALIARVNLSRPSPDTYYLGNLSDDAVPTLVAKLPSLDPVVRRNLLWQLQHRGTSSDGWRSWNASRAHARELLRTLPR
jgi:hypothetical protein